MFEIKTDTRKYTIKDENSEMYFNACMETLLALETNPPIIQLVEAKDATIEIPSNRGGDCVTDEWEKAVISMAEASASFRKLGEDTAKNEKRNEPLTIEMVLEAEKKYSEYGKTYHPIDYDAAYKMAEELAENAERKRKKSFKGFVSIECEHCGTITNTCLKNWQTNFTCNSCKEKTPMTEDNMRKAVAFCKCGTEIHYHTNRADGMFDIECINCGNPVAVEWNNKKKCYVTM